MFSGMRPDNLKALQLSMLETMLYGTLLVISMTRGG